jgi:hypothetical protein
VREEKIYKYIREKACVRGEGEEEKKRDKKIGEIK